MSKVAVILSGCGYLDGSEIHESVLTLLALSQQKIEYQCFAPNIPQYTVVNHINHEEKDQTSRNVLEESARIARGDILALSKLNTDDFDALVLPGGRGMALNLSTFAIEKEKCSINADLHKIILGFHEAKKPIAAMCIAPAILARSFEKVTPIKMTLGNSAQYMELLTKMSMKAAPAAINEVVIDEENFIFTTPGYLGEGSIADLFEGIYKLIEKTIEATNLIPQMASHN